MNIIQNTVVKVVKSQIRAFTLLESLLVLAITSFIIVLFSISLGNTIHVVRGELFIAQFENLYKHCQFQAAATNQIQSFSAAGNQLKMADEIVQIPEEVRLNEFSISFDSHGNNSSLKKITISLPYEHKTVNYQLEMGSGKYKKTIQ